jgi:hypothetical protein
MIGYVDYQDVAERFAAQRRAQAESAEAAR